jgi:hypothetical protein
MSAQYGDVLVLVDAATLLVAHPGASLDSDVPTPIDGKHVYIRSSGDAHEVGHNDSRIAVILDTGDELRMRESALSLRAEESVLFYRFILTGDDVVGLIEPVIDDVTVSVPNPDDLLRPKTERIKAHFWGGKVLATGGVSCSIDFFVLGSDGGTVGYFRWETRIDISRRETA